MCIKNVTLVEAVRPMVHGAIEVRIDLNYRLAGLGRRDDICESIAGDDSCERFDRRWLADSLVNLPVSVTLSILRRYANSTRKQDPCFFSYQDIHEVAVEVLSKVLAFNDNDISFFTGGSLKQRIKDLYVTNEKDFFCEFTDKTFALTNQIMYEACREGRDGYLHEVTITRKGCEQKKGYLLNLNR